MIVIVTGFGRCGSSLAMQMLEAGGMPCTGTYPAFEGEQGAAILDGSLTLQLMERAGGGAVKLLDPHRGRIPRGPEYRAIWMERNHVEQGKSQAKFLSILSGMRLTRRDARNFTASYARDIPKLRATLEKAGCEAILRLRFEAVLANPVAAAEKIALHVGVDATRINDMAAVVRRRTPECAPDLSMELELINSRESA